MWIGRVYVPDDLFNDLARHELVLFVGAGASVSDVCVSIIRRNGYPCRQPSATDVDYSRRWRRCKCGSRALKLDGTERERNGGSPQFPRPASGWSREKDRAILG